MGNCLPCTRQAAVDATYRPHGDGTHCYHGAADKTQARRAPRPGDRVCIIGAGPAGVHMASVLKKRGVGDITVLEKSDRVGGKSKTIVLDGVPHEMGTCYLHADYGEVRELLREYGMADDEVDIAMGGTLRHVFGSHEDGTSGVDFKDWLLAETEIKCCPCAPLRALMPDCLQMATLFVAVKRYIALHQDMFGGVYRYSLPPKPRDMALVDMTFAEWLQEHGLEAMMPFLRYGHQIQGYGVLEEVPALYGLWWNTPALMAALIDRHDGKPDITMLRHGWGPLWRAICDKHRLRVTLNANVRAVTRSTRGVTVEYSVNHGRPRREHFDFLIIASPLKHCLDFLMDATAEEQLLLSSLEESTLCTTLYTAKAEPAERPIEVWPQRIPLPRRLAGEEHKEPQGRDAAVSYQYSRHPPDAEGEAQLFLDALLRDLDEAGERDVHVVQQEPWRYFARFPQEAINQQFPWRLFDLQGARNTWFIGSSACFESVLDVVRYNLQLLNAYMDVHVPPPSVKRGRGGKGRGKGKGKGARRAPRNPAAELERHISRREGEEAVTAKVPDSRRERRREYSAGRSGGRRGAGRGRRQNSTWASPSPSNTEEYKQHLREERARLEAENARLRDKLNAARKRARATAIQE